MFAALLPILLANGAAAELTPDEVQQAVAQFTCEFILGRPWRSSRSRR